MNNTNWKRWGAAGGLLLLAAGYALRRRQPPAPQPKPIAPDAWRLETGRGLMASNVYFVRSGQSWALIDAGWPNCGQLITEAAASLFGAVAPPAAIVLTHIHADHTGSAVELARTWGCPVYVHPDELPLAAPGNLATVERYANPLDRWLILPLLRTMPRARVESMLSDTSLKDVTRVFEPGAATPGLPDWKCIPTPGHTSGHVSFFREHDRVLIAGDALLTVNPNSLWDFVLQKQQVAGPPYIGTWNWRAAKASVAILAQLEPCVLAGGHGVPMTGHAIARDLHAFAARFSGSSPIRGEQSVW